jgi:DNA modification methylase
MPRLAGEVETTNRDVSSSLAIVHVPIDDLKADPANPRRISDAELEALTRSIREFGLIDPIIARKEDRTVIGGHQRLLVARRLGLKSVPVTFLDITKEKAQLLNVALNRISGSFDQELLARLMAGLNTTPDLDLTLSGFDDKDIKQMLRSLESREKRERPESFDLDAALRSAYENPRDLFRLGEHRVLCGDATSQEDVEKLLASTRCQMAFTDPPYNVSLGDHGGKQQGQARRRIKNDSMEPEAWETFCRGWARSLVTYVDGALYICMSTKEWPTVSRILAEAGGHWSTTLIWEKDRFVLGRSDYQRSYEPLWYGWREGAKRHFAGGRDQGDVWRIERPSDSPLHPTTKPLPLVERAIENSSQSGDVVLDLFLGSGSTLVAAERTGRVCVGMELDPHYCSMVLARWEAFTGNKAEKVRA